MWFNYIAVNGELPFFFKEIAKWQFFLRFHETWFELLYLFLSKEYWVHPRLVPTTARPLVKLSENWRKEILEGGMRHHQDATPWLHTYIQPLFVNAGQIMAAKSWCGPAINVNLTNYSTFELKLKSSICNLKLLKIFKISRIYTACFFLTFWIKYLGRGFDPSFCRSKGLKL